MPIPNFLGNLPGEGATIQDLIDYVAELQKSMEFLLSGNLDTANAKEFGGWFIGKDKLTSKNDVVGLSSAITDDDDIRFWAGDAVAASAAFRVYESGHLFASDADLTGKITATSGTIGGWTIEATMLSGNGIIEGGIIRTAGPETYPRIELSATDNILTAYTSAADYIEMKPDILAGTSLVFQTQYIKTTFQTVHTGLSDTFRIVSEDRIELNANGPILLTPGVGETVQLTDFTRLYDLTNGKTLQDWINQKSDRTGIGGTVYVASAPGGATDMAITFIDGARTA